MGKHVLQKAISVAGSQSALARAIGKSQGHVSKWLERKQIPAAVVLDIEKATGIPRQELRPDLYPKDGESKKTAASSGVEKRESIFGCMKGMISFEPGFDPVASPSSEEEWAEIDKEWSDNWDRMMQQ
jgi:DNA-binding transcriptional regulator YdaS (Cro superfamily)